MFRRTDAELDAMETEVQLQKNDALTDEEFCASDVRFHRALVNATQNPVLKFQMYTVIEALQPVANMVIFRFRKREEIIRQHERILGAIRDRDLASAENAIEEQLSYLRGIFAQAQAWWLERNAEQATT